MIFKRMLLATATIAAIGSVIYLIYNAGYEAGELKERNEWQQELEEAREQHAIELARQLDAQLEVERAWLEQEKETRVEYRDKVRTVTKTVREYVAANDLGNCRLDSERMQPIREAIRRANGAEVSGAAEPTD